MGIHRSPVDSPHKGQWHGSLMFSLIYAWKNSWANNRDAGELRIFTACTVYSFCTLHCEYRVVGNRYIRLFSQVNIQFWFNLHVQEQSTNMTTQYRYFVCASTTTIFSSTREVIHQWVLLVIVSVVNIIGETNSLTREKMSSFTLSHTLFYAYTPNIQRRCIRHHTNKICETLSPVALTKCALCLAFSGSRPRGRPNKHAMLKIWEASKPWGHLKAIITNVWYAYTQIARICGQHGAHLGPFVPRWAPCWPHKACYQGTYLRVFHTRKPPRLHKVPFSTRRRHYPCHAPHQHSGPWLCLVWSRHFPLRTYGIL